jgi:two-component system sensor histidine kinase BaeS
VADPLRVRQALDNLVSNALLHGSREHDVVVSVRSQGTHVLLAVADAGEGIAPEDQSRIFETGVRLDGGKAGAGLGLAITRAIAEAHGGTLTVESAPGRGSTFTIALPLRG